MTRPFLFGGTTGSQSQNKYLVEFRAGKMTMKGKMVTPDKRKGLVYINQTDDSLMHFCWKDRKTGTVEDDLIIFPDDAEFKKVPQCTTGRVFVLKFKSSSRLVFYWMQEPKLDKDDELCSKVNEYLNNPPPVRGSGGSGGSSAQGGTDLSSLGEGEIHNIINNMSQQQLVQLLAGQMGVNINTSNLTSLLTAAGGRPTSSSASNLSERSATTTTTTSAPASTQPTVTQVSSAPVPRVPEPTTPSIQLAELQNILSGLNVPPGVSQPQQQSQTPAVDLNNAVTLEALQPLIDNAPLMERLRELLPPAATTDEGPPPPVSEQLRSTVQSPQFQQAMSMFSQALQLGQLGPLMQQFGMAQEVVDAANSGDMDAFVKALQRSMKKPQDSNKKEEEDMNLD